MQQINETKAALQLAARHAWRQAGRRGAFAAATGVGKTKPAIDEMMELWKAWHVDVHKALNEGRFFTKPDLPKFFVAVPTEVARDVNWPDEVREWYGDEGMDMWQLCVTCACYAAMHKYRGEHYALFVGDEGHWITMLSGRFFDQNVIDAALVLTASYPDPERDFSKYELLRRIAPVVFTYPLEQGVEDGVVAPFEIHVITHTLDKYKKNIPAGTKKKPFLTTEEKHYQYLTRAMKAAFVSKDSRRIKFMMLNRTNFLYNLASKTELAKAVMAKVLLPGQRTLIFCGSIKQCEELCGEQVYHSKSSDAMLKKFMAEELDYLGCVKALNESINLKNMDQGLAVQVDSNERGLVQRVGRIVRIRPDYVAMFYILCTLETQDEEWVKEALQSFNPERVFYHTSKEFLT